VCAPSASIQCTLRSLLLRGDVLEWGSHGEINPMHKPYWLPLILALMAYSTLEGLFEEKEDEPKDWSAEKLFSEAKDSVMALSSHFPFNRSATFGATIETILPLPEIKLKQAPRGVTTIATTWGRGKFN
jgi:hypothetical protein